MMFGLIFTSFNNRRLKKKLLNEVGNIYFSNYGSFEKLKNKNEKNDTISALKNCLDKNLFAKFNYINLIYEISKL